MESVPGDVPASATRWMGAAAIAIGLHASACSASQCQEVSTVGPIFTVLDAKSHAALCDATLLVVLETLGGASSGAAVQMTASRTTDAGVDGLPPLGVVHDDGGACTYPLVAGFVTPHHYTIQVSHSGYITETVSNVYDTSVSCGIAAPAPQTVVVTLTPAGS